MGTVRALAAIGAIAALGLSGCGAATRQVANPVYAASDGVLAELGGVSGENLMILAPAAGEPGALYGALTNRTDRPQRVELAPPDGAALFEAELAAGETLLLGGVHRDVAVPDPAAPGAVTELVLSSPDFGTTTVPVPVLDGTLPEYRAAVPTP